MLLNATARLLAVIGTHRTSVGVGVVWRIREFPTRCDAMDMRGGSASAELNRVVWPLMPLLSLVWFVTADLVGHEAVGADTMGSCALLLGLFGVMIAVAIQSPVPGGLPGVGIPGWMARRYYVANPVLASLRAGAGAVI